MRTVPGEDFPLLLGPRSVTPEATLVQDAEALLLGSAQRRTSEASGHLLMEFALRSSRITRRAGSLLKRHPDALEALSRRRMLRRAQVGVRPAPSDEAGAAAESTHSWLARGGGARASGTGSARALAGPGRNCATGCCAKGTCSQASHVRWCDRLWGPGCAVAGPRTPWSCCVYYRFLLLSLCCCRVVFRGRCRVAGRRVWLWRMCRTLRVTASKDWPPAVPR
jgi:hypothetical protein